MVADVAIVVAVYYLLSAGVITIISTLRVKTPSAVDGQTVCIAAAWRSTRTWA
jgi:hypothetical protein